MLNQLKNAGLIGRGGVRITITREHNGTADSREYVAFFSQNQQVLLEDQVGELLKKDVSLPDIANLMRFAYTAKIGRLVLWASMLKDSPEITIEEAGEYQITNAVKFLLLAALSSSQLSDAEAQQIADQIGAAEQDEAKNILGAMAEAKRKATPPAAPPAAPPPSAPDMNE